MCMLKYGLKFGVTAMIRVIALHLEHFTAANVNRVAEECTDLDLEDYSVDIPSMSIGVTHTKNKRRMSLSNRRKKIVTSGSSATPEIPNEDIVSAAASQNCAEETLRPGVETELDLVKEYIKGKLFICNREVDVSVRAHLKSICEIIALDRSRGYEGTFLENPICPEFFFKFSFLIGERRGLECCMASVEKWPEYPQLLVYNTLPFIVFTDFQITADCHKAASISAIR